MSDNQQTQDNPTIDKQAGSSETGNGQPAVESGQRRVQIQIDDSQAVSCYANFCRVTGTPEELIIDLGLNSESVAVPQRPLPISQRVILNFYTAKRLLSALHLAVQRHEAAFGVLETDIGKRVLPASIRQRSEVSAGAKPADAKVELDFGQR